MGGDSSRVERLSAGGWTRIVTVIAVAILTGACAQTKSFLTSDSLAQKPAHPRVLIMPTDIELSEVTAAGLLEPNAAWTATGRSNVDAALQNILQARNATVVRYDPVGAAAAAPDEAEAQLLKLHSAVGFSILAHKYLPVLALPTKKDKFDWSLGDGAKALRESKQADYALFVYFRDSFASSGRVAVIMVAAVLGVGVQGGSQSGFASLVDLRDGNVVWFNTLGSATGDLRKPDLARGATESLLNALPL